MRKHILTTVLLALSALVSCNKENSPTIDRSTEDSGPVMINISPDAVKGEILVKVAQGKAGTRATELQDLRELNNEMAEVLEEAQAVHFERLFTIDPRFEERTKAEGLDRWFCVQYDGDIAPDVMAELLKECPGVEVVECSLPMVEDDSSAEVSAAFPAAGRNVGARSAATVSSPFNDPYVNQMRQWDFHNTGLVANVNTVAGADCNVYRAWTLCTGSPDVIVGVFDQGVKYDHEDLAANMWVNKGEIPGNGVDDDGNGYVDDIYGWNFVDNTGQITFSNEKAHGTHVAGTVSAVNNNGIGICGIAGGSGKGDGVKIMSLQMLGVSESGSGGAGTSGKIRAMKYAADNGAVISQNSWGYGTGSIKFETWKFGVYSAYSDAVRYFIKYAGLDAKGNQVGPMAGGIVVCSAGNDATADLLHYPSADENVIAVASTRMDGGPSYFTNYASWVTISAPGGDYKQNSAYGQIYSTDIAVDSTSAYDYKQGTSMASPHVSGALALAISYFWGEEHHKGLTPEMLKNALLSSSKDVNDFCPEAYKGKMGIGGLDTYNLLRTVKMMDVAMPEVTVGVGQSTTVNLADYFITTHAFSTKVSDDSVVKVSVSVSESKLTVNGLKEGTATVTVSDAKAISKAFTVKVTK